MLAVVASSTVYRGINTIRRLGVVEAERDEWQRPDEVLQALDVGAGQVVVDLGCGAGYFALKLSRSVGPQGRVFAVDIRRLPLLFLRARALLQDQHNLMVMRGDADDPHLPVGAVDAVLVANTYHERAIPTRSSIRHSERCGPAAVWSSSIRALTTTMKALTTITKRPAA